MEKGLAIITGADGGMGQVITAALAKEGYPVIMACLDPEKAASLCNRIQQETGNTQIEVRRIDLASLSSVNNFTGQLLKEGRPVSRLINNAGILTTPVRKTEDGLETIVSVNYVAPYMLTRQLLPLMQPGCRIVNTVSCTYAIGRIEPDFSFERFFQGLVFLFPVAVAGKPGAELLLGMFVGMLFAEVQVDDLLDRFLRVGAHKYSRSDMLEYLFELFFEIVLRNGYAGRSVRPL